jgi:hypothetical protein
METKIRSKFFADFNSVIPEYTQSFWGIRGAIKAPGNYRHGTFFCSNEL